jgi:transcription elongation GreA/GreB family factor
MSRPHTAPRFFLWLCRELRRRQELDGKGDWSLLRRLLDAHTLEPFRTLRTPLRELFDSNGLGEHLVERLTREQCEQMITLLLRDVGLDEHHKEGLRRAALRQHPDLREADEEPLYTTAEALERKRAEFEQITRTDIPHNAEEIRKAAAHGDLRENFEYKAARERHEMLSSRAASIHEELRRARSLDPAAIDPDRIRVGTRIRLEATGPGAARELTILGPWDSDPANGVVSYLAPAVQVLLGKRPGEPVQFLDAAYVVGDIEVWRSA